MLEALIHDDGANNASNNHGHHEGSKQLSGLTAGLPHRKLREKHFGEYFRGHGFIGYFLK